MSHSKVRKICILILILYCVRLRSPAILNIHICESIINSKISLGHLIYLNMYVYRLSAQDAKGELDTEKCFAVTTLSSDFETTTIEFQCKTVKQCEAWVALIVGISSYLQAT